MSNRQESVLEVEGMSCGSCVRHVDHALRGIGGVEQVDVQLRAGKVHVFHDVSRAPVTALIQAVTGAGYAARADSRP